MTVVGQRVDGVVESGARISRAGLVLDGREEVLLCASLFYFRIPRELWAARLRQVHASGYRAIDVYLPWNFHETAPGVWDFEGRRDVATFLDLAQEAGLVVVARPGPYICSEWDGGGLPAWLGTVPGLGIRQNEPLFLEAVRTWFDWALPILAERQHGRGGSVVAVQIENELDFFDCHDRRGYQGALRDLVRAHGLTVPIIACAGQGDLAGATGDAEGVVPACNFYPDDSSPDLEPEVRRYRRLLAERDLPLLITETNRAHATLRRLLASGASLIAPYLQASGYNLGFTPSVGNWGDPAGLMTHDYDFGGYLSPVGEPRPEMADARVLTGLVRLLGADLARGLPEPAAGAYQTTRRTSESPSRMRLASGASLLAVPNLTDDDGEVSFTRGDRTLRAVLPGRTCLLVLENLSLTRWGGQGSIELATADLLAVAGARLTLASAASSILVLRDGRGEQVVAELGAPAPGHPVEQVVGTAESTWVVTVLHPCDVAGPDVPSPSSVDDDAADSDATAAHETDDDQPAAPTARVGAPGPLPPAQRHERAPWSEDVGVWRGRTHYAAPLAGADRVLLTGAGDIVDLTLEASAGPRQCTLVPYGAPVLLDTAGADRLAITAETWGHANFDDARLPNLALGSLRGLGDAWRVLEELEVSALWAVVGNRQWNGSPAPLRVLGGWSSTRIGEPVTYRRSLPTDGAHHHALRLTGLTAAAEVLVDGDRHVLTPTNPWVELPPGQGAEVAVTLPHQPGTSLRARLYRLAPLTGWDVRPEPDTSYLDRVAEAALTDERVLPVLVAPGEEIVLELTVPPGGRALRFTGEQVRVAVVVGRELLGRVWLEDPARPAFTGGDAGRVWLPGVWNTGTVRLLVRGMAGPGESVLTGMSAELTPE